MTSFSIICKPIVNLFKVMRSMALSVQNRLKKIFVFSNLNLNSKIFLSSINFFYFFISQSGIFKKDSSYSLKSILKKIS
jgi:hypothetical protein